MYTLFAQHALPHPNFKHCTSTVNELNFYHIRKYFYVYTGMSLYKAQYSQDKMYAKNCTLHWCEDHNWIIFNLFYIHYLCKVKSDTHIINCNNVLIREEFRFFRMIDCKHNYIFLHLSHYWSGSHNLNN